MRAALLATAILLGGACGDVAAQPVPGQPRSVRVFMLKNADAQKLSGIVAKIFGREGVTATVDARTNALVVAGAAGTLEEVRKLIAELDQPAGPKK